MKISKLGFGICLLLLCAACSEGSGSGSSGLIGNQASLTRLNNGFTIELSNAEKIALIEYLKVI